LAPEPSVEKALGRGIISGGFQCLKGAPMPHIVKLFSMIRQSWKGPGWKALCAGLFVWFVGAAALWLWLPYQPRFTLPATEESVVAGFSPDGRILATTCSTRNGFIRIWDIRTGKEAGTFPIKGELVGQVQLSWDGKILVIPSRGIDSGLGSFQIIDTETSQQLAAIRDHPLDWALLAQDGKTFVFFDPDSAKFWDIPTGEVRLTLHCWPCCLSPDGEWFISTKESEHYLSVRSAATGLIKFRIPCEPDALYGPIISPDGTMIAGDVRHENVIVWDSSTGQELMTLKGSRSATFSRNGKRLAVSHMGNIRLWDTTRWTVVGLDHHVPSGSELVWMGAGLGHGPDDMQVAFLRDRWVSAGIVDQGMSYLGISRTMSDRNTREMKVFDLDSWDELADFSTKGEIYLSPDGRSFVLDSGSRNSWNEPRESIKIFDIPPRRAIQSIVLWPLPLSFLAILTCWLVGRKLAKVSET
jgi:WD40 repeat protein